MNKNYPVDWQRVDTVLLDMDGTILDLAFDTHFWREHLPRRYAEHKSLPVEQAHAELAPIFEDTQGTLDWYCVDFWSDTLGIDLESLKREVAHNIAWLDGAEAFLIAARQAGKKLWLVTNAHPRSLALKLERTALHNHLDQLFSTHDLGYPKEDARFWPHFTEQQNLDPARSLLVDDNLSVLQAAREFGIAQCVAISRPDSRHPPREIESEWVVVEKLLDLSSGLKILGRQVRHC